MEPAPVGGAGGGVEAGLDREQSEKLFSKPSVQKARQRGLANMPHRIPDDAQPTGFRLARPGELIDLVRPCACNNIQSVSPLMHGSRDSLLADGRAGG